MTMYEFLKLLQPVAEQIGDVWKVNMHDWGNRCSVVLEGTTDSANFELELTIKTDEDPDGTV